MKITQDELDQLCWAFHKFFRTVDCKGDIEMWKAIDKLEDGFYGQGMKESLQEIGIEIKTKED